MEVRETRAASAMDKWVLVNRRPSITESSVRLAAPRRGTTSQGPGGGPTGLPHSGPPARAIRGARVSGRQAPARGAATRPISPIRHERGPRPRGVRSTRLNVPRIHRTPPWSPRRIALMRSRRADECHRDAEADACTDGCDWRARARCAAVARRTSRRRAARIGVGCARDAKQPGTRWPSATLAVSPTPPTCEQLSHQRAVPFGTVIIISSSGTGLVRLVHAYSAIGTWTGELQSVISKDVSCN